MTTERPRLRRCAALAVVLGVALGTAASVHAQDSDKPKPGTRTYKTRDVDWQAVRKAEEARGRIDPVTGALLEAPPRRLGLIEAADLAKTRVPVLLPDDGRMVERMQLFAKPDFYVAVLREETFVLQITGTRVDQGKLEARSARRRMKRSQSEEGYTYQRTEYGVELSFTRYNVSYNISCECREPETDSRCKDDAYVRQLAESLVFVGGAPEGDGQ